MHLCDKCNLLVPGSDFDFEGHVGWCDGPMDRLCKPLGTVYDSDEETEALADECLRGLARRCGLCSKEFDDLRVHYAQAHVQCLPGCKQYFRDQNSLHSHRRQNPKHAGMYCAECQVMFESPHARAEHSTTPEHQAATAEAEARAALRQTLTPELAKTPSRRPRRHGMDILSSATSAIKDFLNSKDSTGILLQAINTATLEGTGGTVRILLANSTALWYHLESGTCGAPRFVPNESNQGIRRRGRKRGKKIVATASTNSMVQRTGLTGATGSHHPYTRPIVVLIAPSPLPFSSLRSQPGQVGYN